MSISITFDTIRTEYGFLSSLFPAPFVVNNQRWKTLEHFYQGMKTENLERRSIIQNASSATLARSIGNDPNLTILRQDWDLPVNTDEAQGIANIIQARVMTTKDMIMLQGLVEKYKATPSLASKLLATTPSLLLNGHDDQYWGGDTNMLGRLTVYVRDHVLIDDVSNDDDTGIIFDNLYTILEGQGYTTIVSMGGTDVNIPISEAPRSDFRGLRIRGRSIEDEMEEVDIEETEDVMEELFDATSGRTITRRTGRTITRQTGATRRRRTGRKQEKAIEAIIDVYLQGGYSEERLKEVIGANTNTQQTTRGTRRERREDIAYFVVTQLSKQNLNRFLRIATYNNVRFFSPSELFVTPSKHMLNSPIEKLTPESSMYDLLRDMEGKLPELSSGDKLAKEKGFMPRDIISVDDFSPHYRIIT